jgi:hypothetical protein
MAIFGHTKCLVSGGCGNQHSPFGAARRVLWRLDVSALSAATAATMEAHAELQEGLAIGSSILTLTLKSHEDNQIKRVRKLNHKPKRGQKHKKLCLTKKLKLAF